MNNLKLKTEVTNKLSVNEHAENIRKAIENTKQSMFELVTVVRNAYDDLGRDIFQKELAETLSMDPSVLCKWKQIGESEICFKNMNKLPETFSTLYDISLLEKKYIEKYKDKGIEKLQHLIDKGEINNQTIQSDVKRMISDIKHAQKQTQKATRAAQVLNFANKEENKTIRSSNIDEFINKKSTFRTFVIKLPNSLLSEWGKEGVFDSDIAEKFPLHELRTTSQSKTLQCLVLVDSTHLETGIKVLNAFGFKYRDMLIPPNKDKGYQLCKDLDVILRGERGSAYNLPIVKTNSTDFKDVLEFAEQISDGPNLLVFGQTDKEGWSCLN